MQHARIHPFVLDCLHLEPEVVAGPLAEPVTLEQVKEHSRVDTDAEDAYITSLIGLARVEFEKETCRACLQQTLRLRLDGAPTCREILLPRAPLQSLVEIAYINTAGASVVFASPVDVVTWTTPGRVVLRDGYSWPTDVACRPGAFSITYVAGAPNVPALDPRIVHAVRWLAHHRWLVRDKDAVGTIVTKYERGLEALIDQLKVR